jgi:CheY-like chemotaxis protein
MLRRIIGEEIQLRWRPGADLWQIKMDPIQIDQILANLAVNARDAIVGAGYLSIETANAILDEEYCENNIGFHPGAFVKLTVSDDGCGMNKETLARLFEPFFTTKEVGRGTGLGLATIYGVVKQNNGFVKVYSEPGHGSTFSIYLPRTEEKRPPGPMPTRRARPTGSETILLVEDEEAVLKLGKNMLQRHGYTVLTGKTSDEALDAAQRYPGPIHLLITDVIMPGINGRVLKERISILRPEIKVLYMSGYTAEIIDRHGALETDVEFIQKPFSMDALTEKVRKVLG